MTKILDSFKVNIPIKDWKASISELTFAYYPEGAPLVMAVVEYEDGSVEHLEMSYRCENRVSSVWEFWAAYHNKELWEACEKAKILVRSDEYIFRENRKHYRCKLFAPQNTLPSALELIHILQLTLPYLPERSDVYQIVKRTIEKLQ